MIMDMYGGVQESLESVGGKSPGISSSLVLVVFPRVNA